MLRLITSLRGVASGTCTHADKGDDEDADQSQPTAPVDLWRQRPHSGPHPATVTRQPAGSVAARRASIGSVTMTDGTLTAPVLSWYETAARDLPWRRPETGPWGVLVSEFMLQQTPAARVIPSYLAWLARWPAPADLAGDTAGEAVRMWGWLGYPRRALRLHTAAVVITSRHGGEVPADLDDLLALPGVGPYTARAVAAFAYGGRHAVVDTNVRRVVTRAVRGVARAASPAGDLALVEPLVPSEPATAARFAAALMELGALVCTARAPRCGGCPIADLCAWRRADYPEPAAPARRTQAYEGTDRQVRGLLLAVLRATHEPVTAARLDAVWADAAQRARALDTLVTDGLAHRLPNATYALGSAGAPQVISNMKQP